MIIKPELIKEATVTDSYIVGKAIKDTALLEENETISIFNGVNTAINYVKEFLPNTGKDDSSNDTGRGSFHSFRNFKHALDTFIDDPTSLVQYDPGEINPKDFDEQGNDVEYNVTGDFIDIDRVLEGVPEQFGSLHNGNPRNRRVRIIINIGHLSYVDAKDILHRSERIIRLVDMLESANIRTELVGVYSSECSHTEITIKRFDESLIIEDVAVVTHPDFPRRIMFRISEHSDTFSWGYGASIKLNSGVGGFTSEFNDELTIYIEGNIEGEDINKKFDKLEKDLEQELSEEIPTQQFIRIRASGN